MNNEPINDSDFLNEIMIELKTLFDSHVFISSDTKNSILKDLNMLYKNLKKRT